MRALQQNGAMQTMSWSRCRAAMREWQVGLTLLAGGVALLVSLSMSQYLNRDLLAEFGAASRLLARQHQQFPAVVPRAEAAGVDEQARRDRTAWRTSVAWISPSLLPSIRFQAACATSSDMQTGSQWRRMSWPIGASPSTRRGGSAPGAAWATTVGTTAAAASA